jgi:hypothetical protein
MREALRGTPYAPGVYQAIGVGQNDGFVSGYTRMLTVHGVDLHLRLVVIEWIGRLKNWLDMQQLCYFSSKIQKKSACGHSF